MENLRWGHPEPYVPFRWVHKELSMHFRKANTEPTMYFRKADTEPSMHFRRGNMEFMSYQMLAKRGGGEEVRLLLFLSFVGIILNFELNGANIHLINQVNSDWTVAVG